MSSSPARRLRAVGVSPPGRFDQISLADRRAGMERIADAGLDHVFFADHVSFKAGMGMDGMVQAAGLSQLNADLGVYIGVYLLALRHPVTVARQLASLSEMAPGRVTLGVGVGGEDRHEMEVCGIDPSTRGRRTDECLEILQALMTGHPVDHRGEFYELDAAQILPAPDPPIPITVGGRSPAALDRAARFGDGWLAVWSDVDRFTKGVEHVEAAAAELGRHHQFSHGLQLWCAVGDDRAAARPLVQERMERFYRVPFERFERYSPYGTPADIADFLAPFVAAGCETLNLTMCARSVDEAIDAAGEVKRLLIDTGAEATDRTN
jgi:alkanesulfonate monooxygenase SsuD/methylene tetrahydromethanopterin reductase-like flavin-dependent oxidoreductase (luciferase family)